MYSFGFEWNIALVLLLVIPLFFYLEKRFSRQNRIKGAKFSRIELLEKAVNLTGSNKKLILSVLFILAAVTGVFAVARPYVAMEVPVHPVKLMLIFDTSISMEATDMPPNRLVSARDTAVEFIKKLPNGVRAGVEYFYGSSYVAVSPTEDHSRVLSSLSSLELNNLNAGTAIGSAIDAAVNTLTLNRAENDKLVVILLTDGENNQGIVPLGAARIAKHEEVQIFTIGVGSEKGAYVRGGFLAALDEGTLIEIANITGGKYYRATSKTDLRNIYKELRMNAFSLERKKVELTAIFSGISLLLFLAVTFLGVSTFRPVF